jgi:hypothetical protein
LEALAIAREIIAILGGGRVRFRKYKPITLCPKGKAFCGKAQRQGRTGPCTWDVTIRGRQRGKGFCPEFGSVFRWRKDGNPNLPGLPRYLGRRLAKHFRQCSWHFSDKPRGKKEKIFDLSATSKAIQMDGYKEIEIYPQLIVALESEYHGSRVELSPEIHKIMQSSAMLKVFIYHWEEGRPCPRQLYEFIVKHRCDLKSQLLIAASFYTKNGNLLRTLTRFKQADDVQWCFHGEAAEACDALSCGVRAHPGRSCVA